MPGEPGIVVVTHEASNQRNTDVDIEPFDNRAFGAHLMDRLAGCMGGSGTYVAFVGHRSAQSHREWVRGAEARAKARFPGIRRIGRALESLENPNVAYRKAKAVLAQHPDIGGFEGSSAEDVAGIGRAVREAGRQDTTCVMGTSTPRTVGSLLTDGSVDRIFLWDPALAGQAQDKLALRLLEGRQGRPRPRPSPPRLPEPQANRRQPAWPARLGLDRHRQGEREEVPLLSG